MKSVRTVVAAAAVAALVAGCQQTGVNQGLGTVAGGLAGGVIGNQFGSGSGKVAATAAGAVLGALLGGEIGRRVDENDRRAIADAHYQALEEAGPNRPVQWQNPDTGHYGQAAAGPAYYVNDRNCRDYSHTIYIDGRPEVLRGTACRNPDGTWSDVG